MTNEPAENGYLISKKYSYYVFGLFSLSTCSTTSIGW